MENNGKRDKLIEDLSDRLNEEDIHTILSAVVTLYVAYVSEAGKLAREETERLMHNVDETIKEDWQ